MGVLDQSIEALKVLSPILAMVPAVGDNLKGAAELATGICEMIKTIRENREAYVTLGQQVAQLLVAIRAELQHADSKRAEEMGPRVDKLILLLKKIKGAVKTRKGTERDSESPSPTSACGRISGWLCTTATDIRRVAEDSEEVDALQRELQEVVQEFNLTTMMRTEMKVDDVKELVGRVLSELAIAQQASEEREKRIDRDANIRKTSRLSFELVSLIQWTELLKDLDPVTSAAWDTGKVTTTCTPLTRVSVLTEVSKWAGSSDGSCVFWLNGLAGTGKSTIARTICRHLEKSEGRLGASFFVSRQDQARRNASNIVRTIAHQLALHNRSFGEALCMHIRDYPALTTSRSLEKQITDLIVTPAAALPVNNQCPVLIVIDALDECPWDSRGWPAGELVLLLVRGLLTLSGRLKLFITSRAEPSIQRMFNQLTAGRAHMVMKLHELDKSMVQADIMTYLRNSFEEIRANMPSALDLCDWPLTEDLERLVKLSGVLFVFASTVVRYVGSRRHGPRARLAQVLEERHLGSSAYRFLDALYMEVLLEAAGITAAVDQHDASDDEDVECQRIKAVVSIIVLAQVPLQPSTVAALSGVDRDDALITIASLAALLLLEDGQPVRVFHPSFPDFVLSHERCHDSRFFVESDVEHRTLAIRCLRLMNQCLRHNICELSDPDVPNLDVADLESRLSEHLCGALRYACCFWMIHLTKSGDPDSYLWDELSTFCSKHLFHWLEVLSLLQFWSAVDSPILEAINWCESQKHDVTGPRVAQLLQDMAQTLQLYGPPIRSHALHTYRSAFVTMPSCLLLESLAREPDAASLPRLLSPRVEHLGRAARVLLGHQDEVLSVAYSNDGTRIVSGSADHTIRVWSTITFLELGKIEGHTHSVTSVVFTTDGTRIISSSKDCTVRVWSGVNLEHITTIEGHQDTVSSVAVSPDGTRIISGSHDGTIRVWCAASYSELERLKDHGPEVSSVAYSPNGSHIVSSWGDKVLVFDNIGFEVVAVLEAAVRSDKVSPGDFKSVTFSKDGSQIVAGSQDGTARIWNAANFEETSVLTRTGYHEGWKAVSSVALSSDGGLVIGGGGRSDCIYVWDARSCKEITRLQAHPENVVCMAFSPDSTRFVSGGADHALRVWVTGMYDNGDIASGDRPQIDCVAFSPDGARVMSRSKKDVSHRFNNLLIMPPNVQPYTVRIWTVEKFEELGQITGASEQFAFSPAGIQAVTVMTTGHVNIWSLLGFKQLASVMGSSYSYERILSLAYSPDGTRIVCGTRPGTIQSWSTVSFTKLAEFEAHSSQIKHVMFCSDGRLLFSGSSDGCIRVWNGTTLEKLEEIECRRDIRCMAVSPVGTYIVAALDDKTVIVGSVLSFHELVRLEHHSLLKHVAFSPDGRSVLTLDDHADTRAWTRSEGDDSVWTENVISAVQLPIDGTAGSLGISMSTSGWLRCWIHGRSRLIWLPHNRRGQASTSIGDRVAVIADNGAPTVLKF